MKKFLTFIVAFLTITAINAQNDPNAKKVLDDLSGRLKTYKGVSADFSYSTKDRNGKLKGSVKGNINIKGDQYYIKQGGSEIYSNGSKIWNYDGDGEVTVATVDKTDDKMLTPQKFLSNFYDKDFTYKLVSSTSAYHQIALTPIDKRKNFKSVTVFVDRAKNLVTKAKVIDKADNTIEFVLTNVNTNVSLPDSRFVFNASKYPGVEVINE